ncbi:MAG: hypothetical protein HY078_05225 [Elusimicrobia bacterium]|nr:hypothetical protein [Elusimicrobiota bacterium]
MNESRLLSILIAALCLSGPAVGQEVSAGTSDSSAREERDPARPGDPAQPIENPTQNPANTPATPRGRITTPPSDEPRRDAEMKRENPAPRKRRWWRFWDRRSTRAEETEHLQRETRPVDRAESPEPSPSQRPEDGGAAGSGQGDSGYRPQ